MKIDCHECGSRILAQDLDLPTSMAKCRNCNAVFSFADRPDRAPIVQRERLRAPRPDGLDVRETSPDPSEPGYRNAPPKSGTVTIVRRWFAPQFIFFAFFCVAWDGFLVFWYSNLTSGPDSFSIIAAIFPIAHVAAGVGLTYYTIAGFLNRTTIHLDERSLSVRHAPLPWKGNHTLDREDIKQLYCSERFSSGRPGDGWNQHGSWNYQLNALLQNDTKVTLLHGLLEPEEAYFLEE